MAKSFGEVQAAERRRAQGEFTRALAAAFDQMERPDHFEDEADDVPVERSFEDDGLDTAPVLTADHVRLRMGAYGQGSGFGG